MNPRPVKFYLTSRYSRREEMLGVRDVLLAYGHECTSRWLDGGHQAAPDDHDAMWRFAIEDLDDLYSADWVMCFAETPREPHTNRGGRHVAFGLALGSGKNTCVVGPLENAFTTLADVHVATWTEACRWLLRRWGIGSNA